MRNSGERRFLDRLEVDQALVVIGNGADFRRPCLRQIALGLEHEETDLDPGSEFLFLRLQPPLGQVARRPGAGDPRDVGLPLPARSSRFRSCTSAWEYCSRARARLVLAPLVPSGYDMVRPNVQVGKLLLNTSPSTDP